MGYTFHSHSYLKLPYLVMMVLVPILLEDVEMFQKRHLLVAAH